MRFRGLTRVRGGFSKRRGFYDGNGMASAWGRVFYCILCVCSSAN